MMKKETLECRMYDPDFFNDLYYFIHPYRKMDADTPVELQRSVRQKKKSLNSTIRIPKSCYNTDTNVIFYLSRARRSIQDKNSRLFQRLSIPLSITADGIPSSGRKR